MTGVAGELDNLDDVNEQQCLDCIRKHLEKIVGVKIRLTAQIANGGKNENEAFRYCCSITSIDLTFVAACVIWEPSHESRGCTFYGERNNIFVGKITWQIFSSVEKFQDLVCR